MKIMNVETSAGKRAQALIEQIMNEITDGTIYAKVRDDGICEIRVKFKEENEFDKVLKNMKEVHDVRIVIVQ